MLRLCSEGERPYPGRPVCHAGCSFPGEITGGGNLCGEQAGISKGHISPMPGVILRTW
jgi:hypothetical protein